MDWLRSALTSCGTSRPPGWATTPARRPVPEAKRLKPAWYDCWYDYHQDSCQPSRGARRAGAACRGRGTRRQRQRLRGSGVGGTAKLDDLASLLDEMLADTGGPLTATERKAADRALG